MRARHGLTVAYEEGDQYAYILLLISMKMAVLTVSFLAKKIMRLNTMIFVYP